jgi:hypothetical protein
MGSTKDWRTSRELTLLFLACLGCLATLDLVLLWSDVPYRLCQWLEVLHFRGVRC